MLNDEMPMEQQMELNIDKKRLKRVIEKLEMKGEESLEERKKIKKRFNAEVKKRTEELMGRFHVKKNA